MGKAGARAILIDPFEKEVREIDWSGKYHDISNILDAPHMDVAYFGSEDGDVIYVDDEGLFREKGRNTSPLLDTLTHWLATAYW